MSASSIIVIEDNVDFATILETVLRLWGYTVERFATLNSGLAGLSQNLPGLLILDGHLPDGDGYNLYLRLRADVATRQLPILLLSVSDEVYQLARIASDTDPCLFVGLKPMPLDEIQAIIRSVLHD